MLEQGSDKFGPIGHGWTYSAHPICAAAGVANLKLVDELGLVDQRRRDRRLFQRPPCTRRSATTRIVGDVRGDGLLARSSSSRTARRARFFDAAEKVGPQVAAALLRRGVIGRAMPQGDILGFAPPLCLTRDEADKIVAATTKAVAAAISA